MQSRGFPLRSAGARRSSRPLCLQLQANRPSSVQLIRISSPEQFATWHLIVSDYCTTPEHVPAESLSSVYLRALVSFLFLILLAASRPGKSWNSAFRNQASVFLSLPHTDSSTEWQHLVAPEDSGVPSAKAPGSQESSQEELEAQSAVQLSLPCQGLAWKAPSPSTLPKLVWRCTGIPQHPLWSVFQGLLPSHAPPNTGPKGQYETRISPAQSPAMNPTVFRTKHNF